MTEKSPGKVVEVIAETAETAKTAIPPTTKNVGKAASSTAKAAEAFVEKAAENASKIVENAEQGATTVVHKSILKFVEETPFRKKVLMTVAAATLTTGAILILAKARVNAKEAANS